MKRVEVDLSRCQGHGRCYSLAPSLFRPVDDDGHAEFVGEVTAATRELASRAIRSCPEQALSWEPPDDEDGPAEPAERR